MSTNNLTWHTEKRKINDLIPYEQNPRKMSEKQVYDLKKSLEKFDLVEIPVIDLDNKIVAGHQRLKIMQLLGRGEEMIDVRMPNRKLTDEEFREYLLRSNKNLGQWDWNLLVNFDELVLKDVGFTSEELDKFLDLKEDGFDADEEYQKIEEPKTKLGDLYQLGTHRLLCGDSTKEESYKILMGDEKAQMVFTDPPYNVGYDYRPFRGRKRDKSTTPPTFSDKKTNEEFRDFIKIICENS